MKNYFIYILLFFASISILLPINNHLYAKEQYKSIKQQVANIISNKGGVWSITINSIIEHFSEPEELFKKGMARALETGKQFSLRNGEIMIITNDTTFLNKDYEALFGNNKDREEFKRAMANSICNFYGISREELLHLRQQKVVVNKTKKEINKLFDESLEIINNWANKTNGDEQKIDEARLAKLIADELIKKQNEPLAPDAQIPTVPTLL